jgi:hypothetical protein
VLHPVERASLTKMAKFGKVVCVNIDVAEDLAEKLAK